MTISSVERAAPAGADTISAVPGEVVYFDGRYVLKSQVMVSPDDRGFLLGDGIYEVAAAYDGRFVALDRHMERLRRSLRESRIGEDVADPLESVFTGLLERNGFGDSGKAMVYLQVTRGSGTPNACVPEDSRSPDGLCICGPISGDGRPAPSAFRR